MASNICDSLLVDEKALSSTICVVSYGKYPGKFDLLAHLTVQGFSLGTLNLVLLSLHASLMR